jgi:Cu-processing system permease protein
MNKLIKYVLLDILRNRMLALYTGFLLAITITMLCLGDNATKSILALLNIVLIVVPLVSIIFSTIYYYNSAEFIELLVGQPLKRKRILLSLFIGLSASLLISFVIGVGLPLLIVYPNAISALLVAVGGILAVVFAALALLASVTMRDKARGIGMAVLAWFYFSLLYDGLVLFLLFQFSDYPLETPSVILGALNPVDLGRIVLLLRLDNSAMMGYTGAVFQSVFGSAAGTGLALIILFTWTAVPVGMAIRRFNRKDL